MTLTTFAKRLSIARSNSRALASLLVLLSAFGASAMSACSSSTSEGIASSVDAGASDASSRTSDEAITDDAGARDGASAREAAVADPDDLCPSQATQTACFTCCAQNHKAGYGVLTGALIVCGCADAGPCEEECKTTGCAQATPDTACAACLQKSFTGGGQCLNPAAAACKKDLDCKLEQVCAAACPRK